MDHVKLSTKKNGEERDYYNGTANNENTENAKNTSNIPYTKTHEALSDAKVSAVPQLIILTQDSSQVSTE